MKSSLLRIRAALLVLTVIILLPPMALAARHSNYGEGQLVIKRSANFGINLSLVVYIDGRSAGAFAVGNSFVATLPAGRHEIAVYVPQRRITSDPAGAIVNIEPGRSYLLTAGFHGQALVLR
jgi:hypothetical protein